MKKMFPFSSEVGPSVKAKPPANRWSFAPGATGLFGLVETQLARVGRVVCDWAIGMTRKIERQKAERDGRRMVQDGIGDCWLGQKRGARQKRPPSRQDRTRY